MSVILEKNKELAEKLKKVINLRSEPVAVKLIKEGESYPEGYEVPEKQLSHCQAVMSARIIHVPSAHEMRVTVSVPSSTLKETS